MNRYAGVALTTATLFLVVMAVLVDSPPLFYMSTAIFATLLAARIQAWLAIRGLRFERHIPPAIQVGEPVTIQLTVWSERKLKRPLISIADHLPKRMRPLELTRSLPVAPSFDQPIQTHYSFRPSRRGKYRWSKLTVYGTDALGLVSLKREYSVDPVEMTVHPAPIPVSLSLTPTGGFGQSELETGRRVGAGLEMHGIRDYVSGDPLKTIHWKSVARTGKLMVKEFDAGSGASLAFLLQRTNGTDYGTGEVTTFEAMCGHALYLAEQYLERSARVGFPQHEPLEAMSDHPEARERAIRDALTELQPFEQLHLTDELTDAQAKAGASMTYVLMMSTQEPELPQRLSTLGDSQAVCLVYEPADYAEGVRASSAADPAYIAQLESSGAHVVAMPRVERIG